MRKVKIGKVVSNKMDKTIVVAVEDSVKHPLYKKIVKRMQRFKAHDESNQCSIGDRVKITDGPFKLMVGKVFEIDKENSKAKVNIDLFGQETAVEVDLTQIEHDN